MPDHAKRIDLRLGELAVSASGFDDPIPALKQVLRLAQRVLEETPEISQTGFALPDEDVDELLDRIAVQMHLPRESLAAQPGLIVSAVAAEDVAAAAPVEALAAATPAAVGLADTSEPDPVDEAPADAEMADAGTADGETADEDKANGETADEVSGTEDFGAEDTAAEDTGETATWDSDPVSGDEDTPVEDTPSLDPPDAGIPAFMADVPDPTPEPDPMPEPDLELPDEALSDDLAGLVADAEDATEADFVSAAADVAEEAVAEPVDTLEEIAEVVESAPEMVDQLQEQVDDVVDSAPETVDEVEGLVDDVVDMVSAAEAETGADTADALEAPLEAPGDAPDEAHGEPDALPQSPGVLVGGVAGAAAGFANIFSKNTDRADPPSPTSIFADPSGLPHGEAAPDADPEQMLEDPADPAPGAEAPMAEATPVRDPEPLQPPEPPAALNIFSSGPGAASQDPVADPADVSAEPPAADAPVASIFASPEPEPTPVAPEVPAVPALNIFAGGPSEPQPDPAAEASPPPFDADADAEDDGRTRLEDVVARFRSETGGETHQIQEPGGGLLAGSPDPDPGFSAGGGGPDAAELAARAGATAVPDLLAAAAAWLTLVDKRPTFGRREVMEVFDQMPGDHPRTLEARIKGYGKLVRNGALQLVDDGHFSLSEEERERFRNLIG